MKNNEHVDSILYSPEQVGEVIDWSYRKIYLMERFDKRGERNMTETEYNHILMEKEKIAIKVRDHFPPTIGANGKMLRPKVVVTYDSSNDRYKVEVYYERQEY